MAYVILLTSNGGVSRSAAIVSIGVGSGRGPAAADGPEAGCIREAGEGSMPGPGRG